MRLTLRLLAIIAALMMAMPAFAACSVAAATTGNLGSQSSYDIAAGYRTPLALPPSLSCSGAVVSLGTPNRAQATVNSTNNFVLKGPGGNTLRYRLSADSAGSFAFSQGQTRDYMDGSILSLLEILNSTSFVPPMYVALLDATNVPAGTYTDTVTIRWSWRICRVGVAGACVLADTDSGAPVTTTTLTVTVTVLQDCRISAPAVSFGSVAIVSQFAAITRTVSLNCTVGSKFSVGFTKGQAAAGATWRTMKSSGGDVLEYNIFQPDGVTVWNENNPLLVGTGTGTTTLSFDQSFIAKINPAQVTPPAGSYTDTISVVVTF